MFEANGWPIKQVKVGADIANSYFLKFGYSMALWWGRRWGVHGLLDGDKIVVLVRVAQVVIL